MTKISDLKELDDFQIHKKFIKKFILENEDLFRIIYFTNKNVFDQQKCPYPEDPYAIFEDNKENDDNNHGVVLFKDKNPEVLNYGTTTVLVNFESTRMGNSNMLDTIYIIFRIIVKSNTVEELEDDEGNTVNRINAISKLIDDEFNLARINGLGEIKRISFKPLPLNENNYGITLIYKGFVFNSDLSSNKNFKKRLLGDKYAN